MAAGEFDLFAGGAGSHPRQLSFVDLLSVLAEVLPGRCANDDAIPGAVKIEGTAASFRVFDCTQELEGDSSVFEMVPWMITMSYTRDCDRWSDSSELARFVYSTLAHRGDVNLMLIHDDEQLVECNFTHEGLAEFRDFRH